MASSGPSVTRRQLLERYAHVREDHLRYLEKWGLVRPEDRLEGEGAYTFSDVAVVREVDSALAGGTPFRSVLRNLAASRDGQLTLDFRHDAPVAKVLELRRRQVPPLAALLGASAPQESSAEQYFVEASVLDDGDPRHFDEALTAYRHALEADPYLVPAIINLANIHYACDEIAEAQALYERAIGIDPDIFEAHFNLGNIFHDLGRFPQAHECYRRALKLNPTYAEAHFYLAVTLEKDGRSQEARPHWRAYQQLAPHGEWVELAREFSD